MTTALRGNGWGKRELLHKLAEEFPMGEFTYRQAKSMQGFNHRDFVRLCQAKLIVKRGNDHPRRWGIAFGYRNPTPTNLLQEGVCID